MSDLRQEFMTLDLVCPHCKVGKIDRSPRPEAVGRLEDSHMAGATPTDLARLLQFRKCNPRAKFLNRTWHAS